ncbi:MAG: hypothetical protein LBM19_04690 [Holosporales bacterium]|nr:hypothetical protein [Holosporales bacterium]
MFGGFAEPELRSSAAVNTAEAAVPYRISIARRYAKTSCLRFGKVRWGKDEKNKFLLENFAQIMQTNDIRLPKVSFV